MEVRRLSEESEDAYETFVQKHPNALLYYSLKYKKLLEQLLGCEALYLLAMDGDAIKGVFPMMRIAGKWGWVYNSLPFYGSHGGILAEGEEIVSLLTDAYHQMLEREPVATATIISNPFHPAPCAQVRHHHRDERIGQMTDLDFEENVEAALMRVIEPSARRNIQKALREGIEVTIDNGQFDFLRKVHEENIHAVGGRPKPDKFFSLVDHCFQAGSDYNLYVARRGEDPIGALLVFYYHGVVEYFVPATVEACRSFQPLALTVFRAMVDASRQGLKLWNWGGTWLAQEGVYRFKRKWAAVERRYVYYTFVKNREIYGRQPEELLAEYPHFFVIPFSVIERKGNA